LIGWIARILFFIWGQRAQLRVIRAAKRHGLLAYLRALQSTRRVLIVGLAAFLVVQMMMLAFVGAVVCGVMLWDADMHLKLEVLCGVFVAMFALPFVALIILFSESVWFKASGAEKMVDDLRNARDAA
jgi:hypothetical protein